MPSKPVLPEREAEKQAASSSTTQRRSGHQQTNKKSKPAGERHLTKALPPVMVTYLAAAQPRGQLDCFLTMESLVVAAVKTLAITAARHLRPASVLQQQQMVRR